MIPDDVEDGSQVFSGQLIGLPAIYAVHLQKFFPDKFAQRDISKIEVTCEFPNCPAIMPVKDLKVLSLYFVLLHKELYVLQIKCTVH